ncbi:hypothetical protein [Rhizobacter sp. LjRoot28]|uniref:hypothetical protein n=1 Tax=Rhizobacter sp. LjRoot28 TaxID=3342309 RepID=UPI003ED061E5
MPKKPPRATRTRCLARPAMPSCRGGVSSLLRLAQPVSPRKSSHGMDVSGWFARAASVLTPLPGQVLDVRPSEFAPSQWLVGH